MNCVTSEILIYLSFYIDLDSNSKWLLPHMRIADNNLNNRLDANAFFFFL
jgi:hypothetical protein